jgi:hypothetical protein
MRGLEGGTEGVFLGAGAVVLIAVAFGVGRCGGAEGGGGPIAENEVKCEEAWAVQNDGDDDTVNETAILEQPWCIDHLDMKRTLSSLEDQTKLQEAQP